MADLKTPTTKLFFISQIDTLRDPVRNTRWRVLIDSKVFAASGISVTNGDQFSAGEDGTDNFALHVKSCAIPSLQTTVKPIDYMGFKQNHVVQATLDGDMQFATILLEDMRAYEAMLAWQQATLNAGILIGDDGNDRMNLTGLKLGLGNHKDMNNPTNAVVRNNTIKVELYNWMTGDVILRVLLYNAVPTKVGDGLNLQYATADLMNFNFTLHYDRWSVQIPKGYSSKL